MNKVGEWRRTMLAMMVCMVTLIAPPLTVVAQEQADPFDGRLLPVELIMTHRTEIGLTTAQNKRIGELVVAVQQAVAGYQWEMQSAYFELIEVLDQADIDETRAIALVRKAVETENEIKLEQMRLLIRLRNLLTPEQVTLLQARRLEQLANSGG